MLTSHEGSVSEMKERALVLCSGDGLVGGVGNWLVVDGAWRNVEALMEMIDEVGKDSMAVPAAWQIEASKVGQRNVDDPKARMRLLRFLMTIGLVLRRPWRCSRGAGETDGGGCGDG